MSDRNLNAVAETATAKRRPLRLWAKIHAAIRATLGSSAAFLFWALMAANVVAYLYHMIVARMMTPAEYGILVTLTSLTYVLEVFLRTIQVGVTERVAHLATSDCVGPVLVGALRTLLPLAGAVFVALYLVSGPAAQFFHLGTGAPVILLGLYTASTLLLPVPRGALLGLNRLKAAGATVVAEPLARLAFGVALVVLGLGANGALIGYIVGSFLALLVGLVLVRPLMRKGSDPATPVALAHRPGRYALAVLVINMCLMIMASVDQMTVQHFFPADIAGNYAVTFVLGRVIVMTAISLGIVIFTRSATMRPDDPGRARILTKGLLVMGTISITATGAFLIVPRLIVRIVAGANYALAPAYAGMVGIEMALFGLVYIQTYYHISLRKMQALWPLVVATVLEIALLARYHGSIQEVLLILIAVMAGVLVCVSGLSWRILRAGRPAPPDVGQAAPILQFAREGMSVDDLSG